MKNAIWQIIKKDHLRFRFWLLILVAFMSLRRGVVYWDSGEAWSVGGMPVFTSIVSIITIMLHIWITWWVLQEDSPLKSDAFWRTRPIKAGHMLAAKGIFIGFWMVLAPTLISTLSLPTSGVGFATLYIFNFVFLSNYILVIAVLGIFYKKPGRILLFWVLLLITCLNFASLPDDSSLRVLAANNQAEMPSISLSLSRAILASVVCLGLAFVASLLLYSRRSRSLAVACVLGGFVLFHIIQRAWPMDFMKVARSLAELEPRLDVGLKASAITTRSYSGDMDSFNGGLIDSVFWLLRKKGTPSDPQNIVGHFEITPKLNAQVMPYWVEGGLTSQEAKLPVRQGKSIRHDFPQSLVVEKLIAEGIEVQGGRSQPSGFPLYTSSAVERADISERAVVWQGRIYMALGQMEPVWRISTSAGAAIWGEDIRVRLIEKTVSDITSLRIRSRITTTVTFAYDRRNAGDLILSNTSVTAYALVNRQTKQAVVSSGMGNSFNAGSMIFSDSRIQFPRLRMEGRQPMPLEEWTRWVEEAELVAFRFVEESRGYVDVSAPIEAEPAN